MHRQLPTWPRSWLTWTLVAMVVWVAIAAIAGISRGAPWHPEVTRHPVQFVNALVMFLIAAHFVTGPRESWLLAVTLGITLGLRAFLAPDKLALEHDIAGLIAMALPLLMLTLRCPPHREPAVDGRRAGLSRSSRFGHRSRQVDLDYVRFGLRSARTLLGCYLLWALSKRATGELVSRWLWLSLYCGFSPEEECSCWRW